MTSARAKYEHELADLEKKTLALGEMVDKALGRAIWALTHRSTGEAQAIIADDQEVNAMATDLEGDVLRLIALQAPVAGDLRRVSVFLHCADELERMGDYAKGIATQTLQLVADPSCEVPESIPAMEQLARDMLRQALDALVNRDPQANLRLKERDDEIDRLYDELSQQIAARMQEQPAAVPSGLCLLRVGHNLERYADRVTNIGEYVEFIVSGKITSRHLQRLSATP